MAINEAKLSDQQLVGLVHSVGWTGTRKHRGYRDDATAIAIILAESGGDANAHNDNSATRDDSYGLFQINMYGNLKGERAKRYGLNSTSDLFQPKKNAEVAYDLYKRRGNSFRDWSTYNNGSYLRFINRANAAVQKPGERLPNIEGFLEENVPDPLQEIASLISFVSDPGNWRRVALFVGGGTVLVIGLIALGVTVGAPVPFEKVGKAVARA